MKIVQNLSTSTDWPDGAIPRHWIESLFEKMLFTYGAKFSDQWKNIDPAGLKRHWATQLGSLTAEELKAGVTKLETREWPPTLPEFLGLCRPAPNFDAAIYEAVEQLQRRKDGTDEWSHPAIYWAAVKFGHHELTTMSHSAIKPRFTALLQEMLAKQDLPPIPPRMEALPAPGETQLSRESAADLLGKLKADQVIKTAASKVDHRRWAKLIMEREKRGDPLLSALQVRFAKEALSMPEYSI